jgi:tRNA modification GTPase
MKNKKSEAENTLACVRTAKGTAAIGSIEVCGPNGFSVIQKIFQPAGKNASMDEGQILYGRFLDRGQTLDDGIVGVEGPNRYALHCHGNPLILRQILALLQRHDVQIITYEEMLSRRFAVESGNVIQAEAKLQSLKTASLLGAQIIQNQATAGLARTAQQWLDAKDCQTIRQEVREILRRSQIGRRIIHGVRIVIAGPPNSGKSTLLNRLAGQEQALVSDIPGTTRDWVTAFGRIEPLRIEWIDTAGLDERLAAANLFDRTAQRRTQKQLADCDLILYVIDGTKTLANRPSWFSPDIPVVTVLNKSDLPDFQRREDKADQVSISAKIGSGIEALGKAILQTLEIQSFDPAWPVAFTARQHDLLQKIADAADLSAVKSLARQLFIND